MTGTSANTVRPVPRWLHRGSILVVAVALSPIVLGEVVTSIRAGMADPVWPTEPWYLFNNYKLDVGWLVEHRHRIAGWIVGGLITLLAFGLWWTERNRTIRNTGTLFLLILLGGYGQLHNDFRNAEEADHVPVVSMIVIGIGLAGLGAVSAFGAAGRGLRNLGVVALVAVMIQGLLGGLRVRLDALYGPELAPIHGVFGQVVFCLLVALAVLTGRTDSADLPETSRRILRRASFLLVAVLFVQLLWGAMVRHRPDSLNQRLHLLTAFLAVGIAVWLIRAGLHLARSRVGFTAHLLGVLIAVQVLLGVEAWMGKFGEEARAGVSSASYLPEAAAVSMKQAATRTAHTLVGTGVLAVAVVFSLRVRVKNAAKTESLDEVWERAIAPEPAMALLGKRP